MINVNIEKSWKKLLKDEFSKNYFTELVDFIKLEYSKEKIYPNGSLIFNAFKYCSFNDLKSVFLLFFPHH